MGARFRVLIVGKPKVSWAREAVTDYTRRLARLGGVDERHLKHETFRGDVEAVREAEGKRLLAAVKPRDRLVALDERGEDLTTEQFSALVEKGTRSGRLVFAIGGAYGLSPEVREQSWRVVRLSSLVLNHELARVVLYEQLYRAMTLLDNVPYHH